MFADTKAFSGFAVDDIDAAKRFYGETLGLDVETLMDDMLIQLDLGGRPVLIYKKEDHQPANFTVLNFPVGDVEAAVDELTERGVKFERYEGFDLDEKGIAKPQHEGEGPVIAWFTAPAGNVLSVHEEM